MKICLITDQHFGVRKGNKVYFDYYEKFYKNVFIPYLKDNNIKVIIDLGDTFDNRKNIDFLSLFKAKEMFYDPIKELGITIHMLIGNHTTFYKNTNEINSPNLILAEYDNIKIYSEIQDIEIDGCKITMLPWINSENESVVMQHIKTSNASVLCGHLELNGFMSQPGHVFEGGIDAEVFFNYKKVFSGHFHHRSSKDNIFYLGNPYPLYWNDYNESRGFHEFDTETFKLKFIKNPYTIFTKIYYDDVKTDYKKIDLTKYKDTYIKVYVVNKTDQYVFDNFIQSLHDIEAHEIKVIEDEIIVYDNDDINVETDDTLTILQGYVDDINYHDISSVKTKLKSLYLEALEVI